MRQALHALIVATIALAVLASAARAETLGQATGTNQESLRATPSREGAIRACVKNDHQYLVTDGPYDPGSGEDWFKVTSPSTGSAGCSQSTSTTKSARQ